MDCVDGLTSHHWCPFFLWPISVLRQWNEFRRCCKQNRTSASSTRENEQVVARKITEESIRWHYIPPGSPYFGRLWEAAIKSSKFHLRRVLGDIKLSFEELQTLKWLNRSMSRQSQQLHAFRSTVCARAIAAWHQFQSSTLYISGKEFNKWKSHFGNNVKMITSAVTGICNL